MKRHLWSRRGLFRSVGGAAALLGLRAGPARAGSASSRRFVFVQTLGGWDVTRVFAPLFDYADAVAMEAEAAVAEANGITFVDHADRPSVRAFFEAWSDVAVLNGVYVPSIAHHSATRLTLTGSVDASSADWATLLASQRPELVLPCLVVGGVNFAGSYGVNVGRVGTGGQLPLLASGEIRDRSDVAVTALPEAPVVDRWLTTIAERRAAQATGERATRATSLATALRRAAEVKGMAEDLAFEADTSWNGQLEAAITGLALGLSRCVTLNYPTASDYVAWDTHALNDIDQGPLFEGLFAGLQALREALATTPAPEGGMLGDNAVVVVLSEMGRTPALNSAGGKDHWPYNSAMLWGTGVVGGRVIGAFDGEQFGGTVDLATGELDDGGTLLGSDVIGATLLTLGGLDPEGEGVTASPLAAVLE
jgi:uncharacterized protein (DUF1501 family)